MSALLNSVSSYQDTQVPGVALEFKEGVRSCGTESWLLGIQPRSSERQVLFLNTELPLQPRFLSFVLFLFCFVRQDYNYFRLASNSVAEKDLELVHLFLPPQLLGLQVCGTILG